MDAIVSLFWHHFGSKMAGVTTSRVVAHEPIRMEFCTLPSLHPGLNKRGKVQPIEQVQKKTPPKTKMKMKKQQFKDVFRIKKMCFFIFHVNLLEGRKENDVIFCYKPKPGEAKSLHLGKWPHWFTP